MASCCLTFAGVAAYQPLAEPHFAEELAGGRETDNFAGREHGEDLHVIRQGLPTQVLSQLLQLHTYQYR